MLTLNKNAPIGFFDSGVGGLTVLKEVKKVLPNESYIFVGDTKHVPYGNKTKEQLLTYSDEILKYFAKRGVKAVVMACNTTSSVIYEDIKNNYPFIIYPLVQSCAKVLSSLDVDRLGVFATKATIESKAYEREIHKYNENIRVIGQYCPEWVNIVENNLINDESKIKIVKNDLDKMLENKPDKIILGCTHYPYLLDILGKFISKDIFVDPSPIFTQFIKKDLEKYNLISDKYDQSEEIFVTSSVEKFKQAAKMFYQIKNKPLLLDCNYKYYLIN